MSSLVKYCTISQYLESIIASTTGYTNITTYIGHPVQAPVRPYARISLVDNISTDYEEFGQYYSTVKLNIGLEVLFLDEVTFLTNIDPLIDSINTNGAGLCGIEFLNVINVDFTSENAEYSRANIVVEGKFFHS